MKLLGLEDPAAAARAGLGAEAFEEAYQAGRALTLDEVAGLLRR
jgi:hypothetical protein